jgi:hypothetical protein
LSAAAALEERFAVPGMVDAKLLRDVLGCLAPGGLPPDPSPTPLLLLRFKPPRLKLPPMPRRLRSMRRWWKKPGREPRPRRRPRHRRQQSRRLRKHTPGKWPPSSSSSSSSSSRKSTNIRRA